MKILIVSLHPFPHIGGKSTHILNLKNALIKLGEDVAIISYSSIPKLLRWLVVSMPIRVINCLLKGKLTSFYYDFFRVKLIEIFLFLKRKQLNPDIINCQDTFSVLASKRVFKNTPITLTMHTYIALESTLDNSKEKTTSHANIRRRELEYKALNLASMIICVDKRISLHIRGQLPTISPKIAVVHNFIDVDVYKPCSESLKLLLRDKWGIARYKFVILCPRRLVEKNGVIYAIKALKEIKSANKLLILAGDGPQKQTIENYVRENHLENSVLFLGNVENSKMHELYSLSDITVIPSVTVNCLQEATSLSALEAMSSGLPVIGSNIGGLKEIISHRVTGFLVEEKDPSGIARTVDELYCDSDLYYKVSNNARSYICSHHSFDLVAYNFKNTYRDVINKYQTMRI